MPNQEALRHVAEQYELTEQQKEILFARIIQKKDYREIAAELGTSENACQKCMGEVYKKLNITGGTRGKERRLIQKIGEINKTLDEISVTLEELSTAEKMLEFLWTGEHATARSLFAFISRIFKQFQIDTLSPAWVLKQVIEKILSNALYIQEITKAPSATLRQMCFEFILDVYSQNSESIEKIGKLNVLNSKEYFFDQESLIKNMKILRYILNELPNQDINGNKIDMEILDYRYDQGLSYEQITEEWNYLSEIPNTDDKIIAIKKIEDTTLKYIRCQFHQLLNSPHLQSILDKINESDVIKCTKHDVKINIELYSKIASCATLDASNIQYLKIILDDSKRIPLINFWINEIDHFIAHERQDLKFLEHKTFEAEQKKELKEIVNVLFQEIHNQIALKQVSQSLNISGWIVKKFRTYRSYGDYEKAEITIWNPANDKEFTNLASGTDSMETLFYALKDCLNQAFQFAGEKTYNYILNSITWERRKEGDIMQSSVTIDIQENFGSYFGKATHTDTIQAFLQACVKAINKIVANTPDTLKIFGRERLQRVMEMLQATNSPVYAVSSGDIVTWWASPLGQEFEKANKNLANSKVSVNRIFVISEVSDEIKELMNRQANYGIQVSWIFQKEIEDKLNFKLESLNFLVCENSFTTRMVHGQGQEDGHISWNEDTIKLAHQRFQAISDHATLWNPHDTFIH